MTEPTDYTKIDLYLESNLDESIAELSRLVAQPSVGAQNWGMQECAELVAEMLRARNFEARVMPTEGAPVVYGERAGRGDKTILIYCHYDVQPDLPERWKLAHQRCLQGSVERSEEDPHVHQNGSIEWLRWEIHPWHSSSNEIGGLVMFTENVTEKKRAQQKPNGGGKPGGKPAALPHFNSRGEQRPVTRSNHDTRSESQHHIEQPLIFALNDEHQCGTGCR